MDQRRIFTNDFFDALEAGGAKRMDQLAGGGVKGFESILAAMVNSDQETKTVIGKLVKTIITGLRQINYFELLKSQNTLKGICTALIGLFFMKVPEHSLQVISSAAVLVMLFFAAKRLVHHIVRQTCHRRDIIEA